MLVTAPEPLTYIQENRREYQKRVAATVEQSWGTFTEDLEDHMEEDDKEAGEEV